MPDLLASIADISTIAYNTAKNGLLFFRGIPDDCHQQIIHPLPTRKEAFSDQLFNSHQSSNPRWAAYPKRDQSHICSTDIHYAAEFGTPHIVVPHGNPQIGICPSDDSWTAFTCHLPQTMNDAYELANKIYAILEYHSIWTNPHPAMASVQNILNYSPTYHDTAVFFSLLANPAMCGDGEVADDIAFIVSSASRPDLWANLEEALSPTANNFQSIDFANCPVLEKREIWFSGPATFLRADYFINT